MVMGPAEQQQVLAQQQAGRSAVSSWCCSASGWCWQPGVLSRSGPLSSLSQAAAGMIKTHHVRHV
jgi:hypothetical protein